MENASKALIMAGSILISLMIIAVGVYVFQKGESAAGTTASASLSSEASSFNAKFSIYETKSYSSVSSTNIIENSYVLNTVSDVVTAINAAYDVNYENNYGYIYATSKNWIETDNAVEIMVYINKNIKDESTTVIKQGYYLLEPNKNTVSDTIYYCGTAKKSTRAKRISNFSTSNPYSIDVFLEYLNESQYIESSNYTLYHYYFTCDCEYDEDTGKINSLYFKLLTLSDWSSL